MNGLNALNGLSGLKAESAEEEDDRSAEEKMHDAETVEKMREMGAAINLSRQQEAFHDLYSQHKSFKEVSRDLSSKL